MKTINAIAKIICAIVLTLLSFFPLATEAALPAPACGLTIITHGFETGTFPDWPRQMAESIRNRIGAAIPIYHIKYHWPSGTVSIEDGQTTIDVSQSGGAIILLDWSSVSWVTPISSQDVASSFFNFLFGTSYNGHFLYEMPIHLIGHSRGASLNSALAYALAYNGIVVDQVTTLDPHPVGALENGDDWGVQTYFNTLFADNYWQSHVNSYPDGSEIVGAYNVNLSSVLTGGGSIPHTSVHTYYYGTIDLSLGNDGDGNYPNINWYLNTSLQDMTGYNFSRYLKPNLVRPNCGIGQNFYGFGGTGSRTSLSSLNFTLWPNAGFDQRSSIPSIVTVGQAVAIPYYYGDWAYHESITFSLDNDANAYNGVEHDIGSANQNVVSAGAIATASFSWTPTISDLGTHYIQIQATDSGGRTRYDYYLKPITVQAPSVLPPAISTVSPSSFTGLPIGQRYPIRVIGSGFTSSSTLVLNDGTQNYNSNPAYLTFVSANEIDYSISTGTSQANWTVQVVNGSQTSNYGYFTVNAPSAPPATTGSLVVNLSPSNIGGQWQVNGTYYNSGDVAYPLTPGQYTVYFKSVSGYTTPSSQTVTITANAQTTTSASYTPTGGTPSGSLVVNLSPSNIGGQWQVNGGSYHNSGDVVYPLASGQYTVSFKAVSGYTTPPNQTVTINANAQTTTDAAYTAIVSCNYSLSSSSDIFPAAGGSGAFNVIASAGCAWTASENLSWVTITSGSSGNETHGVFYQVDYNPSLEPRSGVITAAGQSFTISQNGNSGACTYTLSAPGANMPAEGSSNSFSVFAGPSCFWSISRNASWITLTSPQDHTGSDSVQYTVQPYFGSLPRSASILLSADGGQTFVATFTITQAGTPPPPGTLATGLSSPRSIGVDDNYVYWSEPSVLKRVSKTGGGETVLETSSSSFGQMVLDGDYLYYLDSGTKVQKLLKTGGTTTTLATGSSFYDGITVQNDTVFWGVPSGLIYSVPTTGGSVTTVATGSQDITSICVTNNTVVWSQTTYPAVVFAQPIGGSRIALSSGVNVEPGLAIQDGFVYFAGSESIYRVPIGGGTRQTLASNLNDAYDLALDATNIYWVEAGNPLGTNGSVRQMPLNGGPIITLATNLAQPIAITVDSTNVYWLEFNNGSTSRSALKWAAKASSVGDVLPPTISITDPVDGAQFNESGLSVNGTAADDTSVALVELRLNADEWQTATGTTNWVGSVNLNSGANTIEARCRDDAGNYSAVASIVVTYSPPETKLPQFITFGTMSPQSAGDAPFSVVATSSSGLPVYLNVLSGPAMLDTNNVLTLLGAGTVTLIAWQPGDTNYNAATPVQQSFNVSAIPQTITFGALSQQKVGDAPFSLYATSDSGLPVSFSVSGPVVLNGNILALTNWGTVTVTASQPGNNSYAVAADVVQSFFIAPPDNTIVNPQWLSNGGFQLGFYGLLGSNYLIETSTNLVDWQPFTNFTGSNLLFYFNDSAAANFNQRFYRVTP